MALQETDMLQGSMRIHSREAQVNVEGRSAGRREKNWERKRKEEVCKCNIDVMH